MPKLWGERPLHVTEGAAADKKGHDEDNGEAKRTPGDNSMGRGELPFMREWEMREQARETVREYLWGRLLTDARTSQIRSIVHEALEWQDSQRDSKSDCNNATQIARDSEDLCESEARLSGGVILAEENDRLHEWEDQGGVWVRVLKAADPQASRINLDRLSVHASHPCVAPPSNLAAGELV